MENQFDKRIKMFQSDGGGEFRSLCSYLKNCGTVFRHPRPYTHQQNGKAERKHKHIVEMGLVLLF